MQWKPYTAFHCHEIQLPLQKAAARTILMIFYFITYDIFVQLIFSICKAKIYSSTQDFALGAKSVKFSHTSSLPCACPFSSQTAAT